MTGPLHRGAPPEWPRPAASVRNEALRGGVDGAPNAAPGGTPTGARSECGDAARNDALATLALTALTLAGVYSLSRLYTGRSYVGPVLLVAVGVHASAWFGRRQAWPPYIAALASLVTLVVLASWLVLPQSTTYGLPLLGTLRAANDALSRAATDFHTVTAPTAVTTGFLLVTVSSVGVLSMLADWAAFRMKATLEATVASFTIFVFCAALGSRQSRTMAIGVEVSALLAFVVIHQSTGDQETSAWFGNRMAGALKSAATTGAVIGLAVLIVALNLGFRIPSANAKALIAWRAADRAGGATRSTLSPLVSIRGRILDPSTDPVFTVKSNVASYWRLTSLDSFDGTDWNALNTYHSVGHTLNGVSGEGARVEQDFAIVNLDEPWLPAAFQPVRIAGISGITFDPQSGSLITNKATTTGLAYHVSSVINIGQLSPETLGNAAAVTDGSMSRYLQLPRIAPAIVDQVQRIVAGRPNEYAKALAIQNFLRDPTTFRYNPNYAYQGPDPLGHFLLDAKEGFCQQFAGSFAVLARLVGLPTRLAVGWTPGDQNSDGVFQVRDNEAHTWPEVYFAGIGWVPFEPTPGRGMPGAQGYTGVAPSQASGTAGTTVTTAPATPPTTGAARTTDTSVRLNRNGDKAPGGTGRRHHSNPVRWLLVVSGGLVLAAAAVVGFAWTARWLRRLLRREAVVTQAADLEAGPAGAVARSGPAKGSAQSGPDRFARLREAWSCEGRTPMASFGRQALAIVRLEWLLPLLGQPSPGTPLGAAVIARAEVLLSWTEVLDLLAIWGVRRYPSETAQELARRAVASLGEALRPEPDAAPALLRLADAVSRGEFATGELTAGEVERAARDLAILRRALVGSASSGQRLRLAVDPRSTVKVG